MNVFSFLLFAQQLSSVVGNMNNSSDISIIERLRAAYSSLESLFLQAVSLHFGDVRRLEVTRERILLFKQAVEQVSEFGPFKENHYLT